MPKKKGIDPAPLVDERLKKLPWIAYHSYIPWQPFRMEKPELMRFHAVRVEPENPKNRFSRGVSVRQVSLRLVQCSTVKQRR